MKLDEKNILLEQYKLYVEMADRISQRRGISNKFHLSLVSAIFYICFRIYNTGFEFGLREHIIVLFLLSLSIIVCISWINSIGSYKKINAAKFYVILEIEKKLEYAGYGVEWGKLQIQKQEGNYNDLSYFEQWIPRIIIVFSGVLIFILTCVIGFI